MPTFRERVTRFWDWFVEQEHRIEDWFKKPRDTDAAPTRELLSEGVNRIVEGLPFEFGGEFEISFSANGRRELAFLTLYLVRNQPEGVSDRWNVQPLKPAAPEGFSIGMFGRQLGLDDVSVAIEHADGERFRVRFYSETLNELKDNEAYYFFFILMDAALGEGISISHIDMVDKLVNPDADMLPLSGLADAIAAELAKSDKDLNHNPCEYYVGYSASPNEDDNPAAMGLREDIITGFTCQSRMMEEYYNETDGNFSLYASAGVKAAFIWYEHEAGELQDALDLRNTIADRITDEVLGVPDTGRELGIVTGQAMGLVRGYIDLLLFDEPAFLEKAGNVLGDYDLGFYYTDYRKGAPSAPLSGRVTLS